MANTFTMDSEQIEREIEAFNEELRKEWSPTWVLLEDVDHYELDGTFGLDDLEALVKRLKELHMRWGQQGNSD